MRRLAHMAMSRDSKYLYSFCDKCGKSIIWNRLESYPVPLNDCRCSRHSIRMKPIPDGVLVLWDEL